MGPVENGVRNDLGLHGSEPKSALEALAINIARNLDMLEEEKNAAALSRELRLILAQIGAKPESTGDIVDKLNAKIAARTGAK